ncbi:hypothetical protein V495_01606 [Pseudogymnoascus sp. VKM F-4514 (FW-929)]|nr:hypothetical protein V495_01606 [Pseudogymnoascus sp. VKM F-4514 (FW-929)]KFY65219.1 hypothetical protein V497_01478 [Pseudogymnoascus sp. VKM F-4516 (FW-969)]
MDDAVGEFCAITGATPQVARHFLNLSDDNPNQAIQLFFDSPELASAANEASQQIPSAPAASTAPPARSTSGGREDEHGVVHLDSDSDDNAMDETDDDMVETTHTPPVPASTTAAPQNSAYEDDEAMARRLQEEMYAGGDMGGDFETDADGVRAPLARTTETLVGPGADWGPADMQSNVLQQMRQRAMPRTRGRPSVFNQYASSSSIWEADAGPAAHREGLAAATGGQSETSTKAARLAELFRPPFELISRLSWDDARDLGKEEEKWILVNIQDSAVFDCQALNRDIWKHEGIKETVKENFIFMQYSKDDPAGQQYIQYYFQQHEDQNAYPHIAIVDPRTGEQLKVWSGPPAPKAMDFLMQLHEFLDRYSLDVTVKNPVARRKAEKPPSMEVEKLTEQQMMDLALQNSLSNGSDSERKHHDPDDLTKSIGDIGKGKGKEEEEQEPEVQDEEMEDAADETNPAFASIPSDQPHTEPTPDPATTTRIQFKHSGGRVVRRFNVSDPVRRIYEWLKSDPIDGKVGIPFELKKSMGGDLIELLDQPIADSGLKNGTVMVEYLE